MIENEVFAKLVQVGEKMHQCSFLYMLYWCFLFVPIYKNKETISERMRQILNAGRKNKCESVLSQPLTLLLHTSERFLYYFYMKKIIFIDIKIISIDRFHFNGNAYIFVNFIF